MNGNKEKLVVYRASAGSGKTFTLAARYVALLFSDVSARSILAVTFTNKATAEMKWRILNRLYALRQDLSSPSVNDFRMAVESIMEKRLPDHEIKQRAERQIKAILNDYDHFTVCTIDSFLQMLLGEVARMAALQTNFKVELKDDEIIHMAVDELLHHLNDSADQSTKNRLNSFIKLRMDAGEKWDFRDSLLHLARNVRDNKYQEKKDELSKILDTDDTLGKYRGELTAYLAETKIGEMKRLYADFKKRFERQRECSPQMKQDVESQWDCSPQMKQDVGTFLKQIADSLCGNVPSDKLYKPISDRTLKKMTPGGKFEKDYKGPETAQSFMQCVLAMNDLCGECRSIYLTHKLSRECLSELTLLDTIGEKVDDLNRERGRLLLSMTPLILKQLMSNGDDSLFVLEKAGVRYSHIMIDEFQDTSWVQWNNFLPLIREVLSRGGTTLLVGDVKQSIYRWRGGDWDILGNMGRPNQNGSKPTGLETFFQDRRGVVKDLRRNFRSDRNIVAFNLGFFPKAADYLDSLPDASQASCWHPEKNAIHSIYEEGYETERLKDFHSEGAGEGYVKVEAYPCSRDDKQEVRKLVKTRMFQTIKSLLQEGIAQKDMMILVSKNREATEITDFLAENREHLALDGIEIDSAESYLLSASVSVQMLVSALRWLTEAKDSVSLAYVVMHYQNDVLQKALTWEEIAEKKEKLLPRGFDRERLLKLPFYEMMEELMSLLLYDEEGLRVIKDDKYVMCFLDNMQAYMNDGTEDLKGFVAYCDEKLMKDVSIPMSKDSTGIRLMTIHKAKGLEIHTLFIPFCNWEIEKDIIHFGKSNIMWCEPRVKPYNRLPLLPINIGKSMETSIYGDDYALEHFQRRVDNLNKLYVAFTRAKSNLFIYLPLEYTKATKALPSKFNAESVGYLVARVLMGENLQELLQNTSTVLYEKGTIQAATNKKTSSKSDNSSRIEMPSDGLTMKMERHDLRIEFRESNRSKAFIQPVDEEVELKQNEYVQMGNLYHQLFSDIETVGDVDAALLRMRGEGLIESDERMETMRSVARSSLLDHRVVAWFDGSWTLYRECTILERGADGGVEHHRPDRVMMKGEETIVIDFKFGKPKEKYVQQVQCYMQLLRRMGRKQVKGYLWYVYDKQVEEIGLPSPNGRAN